MAPFNMTTFTIRYTAVQASIINIPIEVLQLPMHSSRAAASSKVNLMTMSRSDVVLANNWHGMKQRLVWFIPMVELMGAVYRMHRSPIHPSSSLIASPRGPGCILSLT